MDGPADPLVMSAGVTLALLSVTGGITTAIGIWLGQIAKTYQDQIVSGHVRGIPMTQAHRRMILDHHWIILIGIAVAYLGVSSFGLWQIGVHAPTPALEALCKASSWAIGILALSWLVGGIRIGRVLRRTLEDSDLR